MTYRLIPRAEWGARYPNGTGSRRLPATEAWLHHSVTIAPDLVQPFDDDYEAIRTLERIGQDRFGAGISYTRCVTPAGLVFEGHSIDRVGTHTQNHNTAAVGYCLVGNYDVADPPQDMLRALAWCLQEDHRRGWLDRPALDGGHQDLKQTACPGGYAYVQIPAINWLAAGPPIVDDDNAERTEDVIITVKSPNRCGILSGGMLFDITDDSGARQWAQSAINKSILAQIEVTEATWSRLASTSHMAPAPAKPVG